YVRYGTLPQATSVLYGVAPVIIAVVVQALVGLTKTAVKSWTLALVGTAALVAVVLGVHELVVLAAAGALALAMRMATTPREHTRPPVLALPLAPLVAPAAKATSFGLAPLFLVFLEIGSVLFGSGYVLLAFLRADLVERLGWLGEAELLDAVAVGQITP